MKLVSERLAGDAAHRPRRSRGSSGERGAGGLGWVGRSLRGVASLSEAIGGRRANLLLFAVTLVELAVLVRMTSRFGLVDWIYVSEHVLVLGISLVRRPAVAQDSAWPASLAVVVSYAYPYAQVIYLSYLDGYVAWPGGGAVLVTLSALLDLAALISIGTLFGVRPALRGLATGGPYRLVRHPMYLAYFIADAGYLLQEWNIGTVLIVVAGWASLVYRIRAEERILSMHPDWAAYVHKAPYRLVPGLW
jgi:protein-S-isoprenylcysteine O-methyltransferase Ste14